MRKRNQKVAPVPYLAAALWAEFAERSKAGQVIDFAQAFAFEIAGVNTFGPASVVRLAATVEHGSMVVAGLEPGFHWPASHYALGLQLGIIASLKLYFPSIEWLFRY